MEFDSNKKEAMSLLFETITNKPTEGIIYILYLQNVPLA